MFKDIHEVRAFIEWAQTQKVKRIRVGDVEVEPLPSVTLEGLPELSAVDSVSGYSPSQANQDKEDEDLLFWSSRQG